MVRLFRAVESLLTHMHLGLGRPRSIGKQFEKYQENPAANPAPDGYAAPFYKADREAEYRQAHAVFSKRLRKAQGEADTR